MATESREDPDIRKSVLRRERGGDEWVAYEPAADDVTVGRGPTELDAVADFVERLRGGADQ